MEGAAAQRNSGSADHAGFLRCAGWVCSGSQPRAKVHVRAGILQCGGGAVKSPHLPVSADEAGGYDHKTILRAKVIPSGRRGF